jgi:predicted transcriptional regulator
MIAIMAAAADPVHHARMTKPLLTLVLALGAAATAWAQHHAHPQSVTSQPAASSYAGEQAREIKALSAPEQRAWLEGQGMGLAKAAELNSHPGPMHVLEHAQALSLTEVQHRATRELMDRHKSEVRALGAELVAAERRLDDLIKSRRAAPAGVSDLAQQIGSLMARIRASHLITHLEQTALMRPEQVAAYDRLRGYAR